MDNHQYKQITAAADRDRHVTVIELCRQSMDPATADYRFWSLYSLALFSVGRLTESLRATEKAITTCRRSRDSEFLPWLICRKGHIFRERGEYDAAIRWYLKASKLDCEEATFLIFAGLLQFRLGATDKAIKTLSAATKCTEGSIDEAYYNLGVVYLARADYEAASLSFEEALMLDPKYGEARRALTDIRSALKVRASEDYSERQ